MYTKTLVSITRADREIVGERACDLALLAVNEFTVPLSFVVTNKSFESFVEFNGLQNRIGQALSLPPMKSYEKIRELLISGKFDSNMVAQIVENYESLDVKGSSAADIVAHTQAPFVSVILSPNHTVPDKINEGIILNVKGLEELLLAVKECWACLFTPTMHLHREKAGLGNVGLNTGIIIQASTQGEVTAEGWSAHRGNVAEIVVQSYYGMLDLSLGVDKDEFRLAREYLKPIYQSVGAQTHMLSLDEDDKLSRVPIGKRGEEQKLDDRTMIELGRLTKKASKIIDGHVRVVFDVKKEVFSPVLVNRLLLTAGSAKLASLQTEERIDEGESASLELAAEQLVTPQLGEEDGTSEFDDSSGNPIGGENEFIATEFDTVQAQEYDEMKQDLQDEAEQLEIISEFTQTPVVLQEDDVNSELVEEQVTEPTVNESNEQASEVELVESSDKDEENSSTMEEVDDEDFVGESSTDDEEKEDLSDESIFSTVHEDSIFDGAEQDNTDNTPEQIVDQEENNNSFEEHEDKLDDNISSVASELETVLSIDEAYTLVQAALAQRYESRFKEQPPENGVEMFFELSSEIIIPHEREITYLLNIKEKDAQYTKDDEKKILGIVHDFLENLR